MAQVHLANYVVAGLIATFFFAPGFVTEAEAFGPDCAIGGEPEQCVPNIWFEVAGTTIRAGIGTQPFVVVGTVRITVQGQQATVVGFGAETPCAIWQDEDFACQENTVFGIEKIQTETPLINPALCLNPGNYKVDVDNDGDVDYSVFSYQIDPC